MGARAKCGAERALMVRYLILFVGIGLRVDSDLWNYRYVFCTEGCLQEDLLAITEFRRDWTAAGGSFARCILGGAFRLGRAT